MTSSTITKNQVQEHFTSTTQDLTVISAERVVNVYESSNVRNADVTGKKNSEREYNHWIEQKLSQRSYISGYKGL
jgi:hypothetical protein